MAGSPEEITPLWTARSLTPASLSPIITVAGTVAIVSDGAHTDYGQKIDNNLFTSGHNRTANMRIISFTIVQVCISEILAAGGIFMTPSKFDIYS